MHKCAGNVTIIGSDNGLAGRRQAIIWTNAGILLTGPLWTNLSEILIEILTISFKKMRLKRSSSKWRPFCLGPNVSSKCLFPLKCNFLFWYTVEIPYNTAPYITGSNIARLCHGSQNSWSKMWIPIVKSAPVRVIFTWKSVPKKSIHGSSDIYLGTQWKQ